MGDDDIEPTAFNDKDMAFFKPQGKRGFILKKEDTETAKKLRDFLKIAKNKERGNLMEFYLMKDIIEQNNGKFGSGNLTFTFQDKEYNISYETGKGYSRNNIFLLVDHGESLGNILQKGPLEDGEQQKIVDDMEIALQNLHNLGYHHRDIKIDNICWDEEKQKATLIDFGAVATIKETSSVLTQEVFRFTVGATGSENKQNGKIQDNIYYLMTDEEGVEQALEPGTISGAMINPLSNFKSDYYQMSTVLLQVGKKGMFAYDENWKENLSEEETKIFTEFQAAFEVKYIESPNVNETDAIGWTGGDVPTLAFNGDRDEAITKRRQLTDKFWSSLMYDEGLDKFKVVKEVKNFIEKHVVQGDLETEGASIKHNLKDDVAFTDVQKGYDSWSENSWS